MTNLARIAYAQQRERWRLRDATFLQHLDILPEEVQALWLDEKDSRPTSFGQWVSKMTDVPR